MENLKQLLASEKALLDLNKLHQLKGGGDPPPWDHPSEWEWD